MIEDINDPKLVPTQKYEEAAVQQARRHSDTVPEQIGPYRILERIGSGGMGDVYRAEQRSPIRREVAIKYIKLGMDTKTVIARFEAERQALALMEHPHIAKVLDAGTDDTGRPFFVMEYVKGKPITEYADKNHLTISERLKLVEQVCQAIQHAHHKGVIHRDLKPSNVLVSTHDGNPFAKVIDFGIAKAIGQQLTDKTLYTLHDQFVGTPQYMSPEQAEGSLDVDTRSDVYSLGVLLYELLTGTPPFSTAELKLAAWEQFRKQIMEVDPPRPSTRLSSNGHTISALAALRRTDPKRLGRLVHGELDWIVMKALEKDRKRRYETPISLAEDIQAHLRGEPVQAAPPSTSYRLRKFVSRNRGAVAAVSSVIATLIIGIIGTLWNYQRAEKVAASERVARLDALQQRDKAEVARQNAVVATEEANRQREASRLLTEESRQRSIRLCAKTAEQFLDSQDKAAALLWFQRTWELDRDSEQSDSSHRVRIAGILEDFPEMSGVCFHRAPVMDACFSPNGERVLTRTTEHSAFIWDYASCRLSAPPLHHSARIQCICYGPDGRSVATASADGIACVWDSTTGVKKFTLEHDGPVNWLDYHPDGSRIVTAAEGNSVRLWNSGDGTRLEWDLPLQESVEYCTFSPDGEMLLTASRDNLARVWSTNTAELLSPEMKHELPSDRERYEFNYKKWPRFSPDGKVVLSFDNSTIFTWRPGSTEAMDAFKVNIPQLHEVRFIPQSTCVLACGYVTGAEILDLATQTRVRMLLHPRIPNQSAVSPDGKRIVTSSSGGALHVWDAKTGESVSDGLRCADFCQAAAYSLDGSRYLTASRDGTVRVWSDNTTVAHYPYLFNCGRANARSWDRADGAVRFYSADARRWIDIDHEGNGAYNMGGDIPTRAIEHPHKIRQAYFSADGSRFIVLSEGAAQMWKSHGGQAGGPLIETKHLALASELTSGLSNILPAGVTADGTKMLVLDDERSVSIVDTISGRRVFGPARHPEPGPVIFGGSQRDGWVSSATLSSDGRRLAVGINSSGTITVFDVTSGEVLHHNKRYRGYLTTLQFSADGTKLLVFSTDNVARLFDTATGEPVGPSVRQLSTNLRCDVTPDGNWLGVQDVSSGGIRVIDVRRGERLLTFKAGGVVKDWWFSASGHEVNFREGASTFTAVLPRLSLSVGSTGRLVAFLTGQQVDSADGIEFVDQSIFMADSEMYRQIFLEWKKRQ